MIERTFKIMAYQFLTESEMSNESDVKELRQAIDKGPGELSLEFCNDTDRDASIYVKFHPHDGSEAVDVARLYFSSYDQGGTGINELLAIQQFTTLAIAEIKTSEK
jgi:hypothetical protein